MKKSILAVAFVVCFGAAAGTAHAQRSGGHPAGGGGLGPTNNGGGGGGGGYGGGGGNGAISGVTHHPVWVPGPNVSAKNDGEFRPTSYQSYDKAVEMGKAMIETREPSVAEVARMSQEQKAAKARFTVVQDVAGRIQEVKAEQ